MGSDVIGSCQQRISYCGSSLPDSVNSDRYVTESMFYRYHISQIGLSSSSYCSIARKDIEVLPQRCRSTEPLVQPLRTFLFQLIPSRSSVTLSPLSWFYEFSLILQQRLYSFCPCFLTSWQQSTTARLHARRYLLCSLAKFHIQEMPPTAPP